MAKRIHKSKNNTDGDMPEQSQSASGDGNVQIVGDGNTVSLGRKSSENGGSGRRSAMTVIRQNWILIVLTIIFIFVTILIGWPQLLPLFRLLGTREELQKSASIKHISNPGHSLHSGESGFIKPSAKDRKATVTASIKEGDIGMASASNGEKPKEVTQIAHGDKNVQIVGNDNVVDNRTYVYELAGKAELSYMLSDIEHTRDGRFSRTLTIKSIGTSPVYYPKFHLEFNRNIEKVQPRFNGMLQNVQELIPSDRSWYSFSASEFIPGFTIQFIVTSTAEFNISGLLVNDKRVF